LPLPKNPVTIVIGHFPLLLVELIGRYRAHGPSPTTLL
jgi:hypothetical protein